MRLEKLKLAGRKVIELVFLFFVIFFTSCDNEKQFPIYGERDVDENGDTLYHTVSNFEFTNQFGKKVNQDKYKGKVYVADFFFTTCPGTCPIMTRALSRVQKELSGSEEKPLILSHTVDPEADSIPALLEYGKQKEADFSTWDFVTGYKADLYQIATDYLVVASEDVNEDTNFIHSDLLILVDRKGQVRGMYSGIEPREVDQLIKDVVSLQKEK